MTCVNPERTSLAPAITARAPSITIRANDSAAAIRRAPEPRADPLRRSAAADATPPTRSIDATDLGLPAEPPPMLTVPEADDAAAYLARTGRRDRNSRNPE